MGLAVKARRLILMVALLALAGVGCPNKGPTISGTIKKPGSTTGPFEYCIESRGPGAKQVCIEWGDR